MGGHRRAWLCGCTALVSFGAMVLAGAATPAMAQSVARQATFDIPAGPLETALLAFADQANVQLAMRARDVEGLRGHAVRGQYSLDEALRLVIGDAPVAARWAGASTVSVRKARPAVRPVAYRAPAPAAAIPAQPSAAMETDDSGLEDIVVTAQRRAEKLQDVPIAVTAVTGAQLAESGVNAATDLPRLVPGLVTFQLGTSFLPYIRGVGSNQSGGGNESPVAVYLDGIYQGAKAGNITDLGNIERIEVLKGPQGTLFGRNATGGAINIITRDPGDQLEFSGEIGYGRFDDRRAKAYASGALTDTLRVSASFSGRWDDGYIKDVRLNRSANPVKSIAAMVKAIWQPDDSFTARFSASYSDLSDSTTVANHATPGTVPLGVALGSVTTYSPRETIANLAPFIKNETKRVGLDLRKEVGDVELVSLTGYTKADAFVGSDTDLTLLNQINSGLGQPGEQFTQELQLQSTGNGPLTWILGAHYMWLKEGQGKQPENFTIVVNGPAPVRPADLLAPGTIARGITSLATTNAAAAFAQGSYKFTDRTQLTLGLRYTHEKKSVDGRLYRYTAVPGNGNQGELLYLTEYGNDGLVFGTVPITSMDLKKSWSKITWRIAVDHKFTDDVLGYVSYNRGFKSGSFVTGNVSPTQAPVDPEILDAYEAGLKTELFDRRVRFNIAGFYYDYKDIQVSFLTPLNTAVLQNAAAARMFGIDIDFAARATNSLTIRGGLNWLDSKYKSFERAQIVLPRVQGVTCLAPAPVLSPSEAVAIVRGIPTGGGCNSALNATGLDLTFAPKLTGNIGFDYNAELGGGSRLLLSSTLSYNDGYDISPGGYFGHVRAHETLSASVTWYAPDDRYFVRVWGDNLTDDIHAVNLQASDFAFRESSSKPITYGFALGFKFRGQ